MRQSAKTTLVAVWLTLSFFACVASGRDQYRRVEAVTYDWGHNHRPYTFILDRPQNWNTGGDWTRLTILAPDGKSFIYEDKDGLTEYSDELPWILPQLTVLVQRNPIHSTRLLFLPFSKDPSKPFLLFVFGWAYGSSPGSFRVIGLVKGSPRLILYRSEFQMVGYKDVNRDGYPEIIGLPCLSQEWGDHLLTYDPYWVFSLPHAGTGNARLSLALSKAYNEQYLYGWAGPNCTERLAVVLHPPGGGKPVIMNASAAEKLMEKGGSPRK